MPDPALHEIATFEEGQRDEAVREAAEAAGDTHARLLAEGEVLAAARLALGALPVRVALGQTTPKDDDGSARAG